MTDNDFQRIKELLATNLNAVEERINGRLDKLEYEMKEMRDGMESRFDAIGQQFNEIDTRFAALEEKIDRNYQEVTKRIDSLSTDIEAQQQEALQAQGVLKLLTTEQRELTGRMAIVESKLQAV